VTPDLPQVEIAIIEMTNSFRRQNRLSELKRNGTLDKAARAFARYMARSGKFAHTADGRRPADRTLAAGYKHCRISENLALNVDSRGFRSRPLARAAIEGWKKSPPHRKAMIDPLVVEIGVGVAKAAGEHRYLAVQLFGRPRALQYQFTVRNTARRDVSYAYMGRSHDLPSRTEVRHTECSPTGLSFKRAYRAGAPRSTRAKFPVSNGDLFVVRVGRRGSLVVDHRPRTR
jgi:Cysteine-rich secretory protein family